MKRRHSVWFRAAHVLRPHVARAAAMMLVLLAATPAARGTIVTFQQGSGGYADTVDTYLNENAPTTQHGGLTIVKWDSDDPGGTGRDAVGLLRFDNIFGAMPTQVPIGATILSATLTYTVSDAGNAGNLYESTIDWDETTTWDTFGGAAGVQAGDIVNSLGSIPGGPVGTVNFDVTASIARWAADPAAHKGWVFIPLGTDGVQFRSSEYATLSQRPKLTVNYTLGPVTPQLVRAPYLQQLGPTTVKIVWRTDILCDSRVRYGLTPGAHSLTVSDAALVTDHIVTISGLAPATRYYYDAGTTTEPLAGGDATHYFQTPPLAGTRTPFTAWVVGDSGNGSAEQYAVRDAMLAHTGATPPDLFVHMGDIAYDDGTEQEFTDYVFTAYASILRNTSLWPTLGNHEGTLSDSQTQTGPYYSCFVLPSAGQIGGAASGTEAYYSFDYANAHFICLDSHDSPRTPGSAMLIWLANDLSMTDQDWVVAFFHHPPYSKGTHDSDIASESGGRLFDMRTHVLPVLEAGGADLVLAGHSHIYERSYLVDGAYDTPTTAAGHILDGGDGRLDGGGAYLKNAGQQMHEGAVYVVAGHGGAPVGGTGGHPLMYYDEVEFGSCLMTFDGRQLTVRNLRDSGVISDYFTMIKTPPGDTDVDGDTDGGDLVNFVNVLLGVDADPQHVARSDLNFDSAANGDDIAPFVSELIP